MIRDLSNSVEQVSFDVITLHLSQRSSMELGTHWSYSKRSNRLSPCTRHIRQNYSVENRRLMSKDAFLPLHEARRLRGCLTPEG